MDRGRGAPVGVPGPAGCRPGSAACRRPPPWRPGRAPPGTGVPAGMRKTAASVTTPRRPAQPTTRTCDHGVRAPPRSRSRRNKKSRAPATQASRRTITVTSTAAQNPMIAHGDRPESPTAVKMRRACRPISRNTAFSSRNWMVAQLTRSLSRERPDWKLGDLVPDDESGHHDRDHAGSVRAVVGDGLGRHVRRERHQQRDGGVEDRFVQPLADRDGHRGDQQPDQHAAPGGDEESDRHVPRP